MRKLVGELYDDVFTPLAIVTMTRARTDFIAARGDAITLRKIHDQATGGRSGRPKQELAALKRSSLILAVTAWESFVENTISDQLDAKLAAAVSPDVVSSVFNAVVSPVGLKPARYGRVKTSHLSGR